MSELKKKVCNLQKLLKQPDHPEKYYLKVLAKLDGYDMTLDILKETGIGKVVNTMKKREGDVADKAKALVKKWMELLGGGQSSSEKREREEEGSRESSREGSREGSSKRFKKAVKKVTAPVEVYFNRPPGTFKPLENSGTHAWSIFSGRTNNTEVQKLSELCKRSLAENVSCIYHVGTLNYEVLSDVLSRANPEQLNLIEHRNPHLASDTVGAEVVWKKHVVREFKTNNLVGESWKTMYWDRLAERKQKLARLTNSINQKKQDKADLDKNKHSVKQLSSNFLPKATKRRTFGPGGSNGSNARSSNEGSGKPPLMRKSIEAKSRWR